MSSNLSSKFYLNHMGYKDELGRFIPAERRAFYLNHMGYKVDIEVKLDSISNGFI